MEGYSKCTVTVTADSDPHGNVTVVTYATLCFMYGTTPPSAQCCAGHFLQRGTGIFLRPLITTYLHKQLFIFKTNSALY
jgi:hypothetical protein